VECLHWVQGTKGRGGDGGSLPGDLPILQGAWLASTGPWHTAQEHAAFAVTNGALLGVVRAASCSGQGDWNRVRSRLSYVEDVQRRRPWQSVLGDSLT